ncbi:MAG: hypothetical protein WA057_03715 [Candidatus Magasanikiibacteriota bacterium]
MNKKIIIIILLILTIAGGVYYFWSKSENNPNEQVVSPTQEEDKDAVRVYVKLPEILDDIDRDGITDDEEKKLGLSPEESDTDYDGLSDNIEINKTKTDPKKPDTDGDGFNDGLEVIRGYNPLGEGKL